MRATPNLLLRFVITKQCTSRHPPTTFLTSSHSLTVPNRMAMAWGVMAPAAPAEPEPAPPVVDDEEEDFPAMGAVVMKVKGGNVEDEYRCVSHVVSVSSQHV